MNKYFPQIYRIVARHLDRIALGLMAVAAAFAVAEWVYIIIGHGLYFDGGFANGAFQSFNPMRRFMDGQVPGKDFYVFHGIGTVWLHLPAYVIFGQTLSAAEISRFLTSGLLHIIASFWLWRVLSRRVGPGSALTLALLFLVTSAFIHYNLFTPQNSLLGARSIFPIFVGLALLSSAHWIVIAVLACAALLASPEHGIATVIALAAIAVLQTFPRQNRAVARDLAFALLGAVLLFYIVLWAASDGAVMALLRYALVDVPSDQFWYFGVYPNWYLPVDAHKLFGGSITAFIVLWAVGVLLSVLLWKAGSRYRVGAVFLVVYATFGTVSILGYIYAGNLQGSERALALALILAAAQYWDSKRISVLAMVSLVALSAWGHSDRKKGRFYWPKQRVEPGGFLSPYWKGHLAAVDRHAGSGTIWSIYAGLPEHERKTFAPSFDYIIHALGPRNRELYSRRFDQISPSLVRLDNAGTWFYGPWLIASNWDFYRRVFDRYELAYRDRMATLWTPADPPPRGADTAHAAIPLPVTGNCFEFAEPTGRDSVYSLKLEYSLDNPWSGVPVLGLTPRIILLSDRPQDKGISLPPPQVYGESWTVPSVLKGNETTRYCLQVHTFLPMVSGRIRSVSADLAPVTDSAKRYLFDLRN